MVGLVLSILASPVSHSVALAGHTFGSGDCWRIGTPYTCRNNWAGPNTLLRLRLVDLLGDATITAKAEIARYNWSVASGPQLFSWSASSGDSLVYLYRDYSVPLYNGLTANYDQWGYVCGYNPCGIQFTDIKVHPSILSSPYRTAASLFAHEMGHSLGLSEHNEDAAAIMKQNYNSYEGPQAIDRGPIPACSTSNNYLGVKCIYNYNY